MGAHDVHALLRRPDPAGRPAQRPARRATRPAGRPDALHRCVAGLRSRLEQRAAPGGAGRAGCRCGTALPRRARSRHRDVHGRRPDQGTRRVGRAERSRYGARRGARRRAHLGVRLAVDLRDQRPDRSRHPGGRLPGLPRSAAGRAARAPRHPGRGAGHRRHGGRDLRPGQRRDRRLGRDLDPALPRCRRGSVDRLRPGRAGHRPAAAPGGSAARAPGRCRRLPDAGRHRADGRRILPRLVRAAASPRLRCRAGRALLPAGRGRRGRRGAPGRAGC